MAATSAAAAAATATATTSAAAAAATSAAAAVATPASQHIILVRNIQELVQRAAGFAPGAVIMGVGTDSCLLDAESFWRFITVRRGMFEVRNMETLVHKSTALDYVQARIDSLTRWHNSIGKEITSIDQQISVLDHALQSSTPARRSSESRRPRWPLEHVEFFLNPDPEAVAAAGAKRKAEINPDDVAYYKKKKFLPYLCNSSSSSSSSAHRLGIVAAKKEMIPNQIAQNEMRSFMRQYHKIERDSLESLRKHLFKGILTLRTSLDEQSYLGCGPTDLSEFYDDDNEGDNLL